ncbi:MAG: hypothetical protein HRU07_09985 [Nitrosopumilus sp.]|nr:hypothetical protein [Nitrosopumilus sp.]NRA06457.1 hypothetical protein [Nitrosopumilus sp.]
MNQLLDYLLIAGIIVVAGVGTFSFSENYLNVEMTSQHDKIDLEKKQSSEQVKLIEVIQAPLRIDVMNTGLDVIEIKKLFVDGVSDDGYSITDRFGSIIADMPRNEIVTITPSINGSDIKIISKNNKIFSFQ